jgi:hypothetical protein
MFDYMLDFFVHKIVDKLVVVVHIYNSSTWEAEEEGLRV